MLNLYCTVCQLHLNKTGRKISEIKFIIITTTKTYSVVFIFTLFLSTKNIDNLY